MYLKNEKADQAMCLVRKHPFGDEQAVNKVLMPGESYECSSIYKVEVSYRDLTAEEKANIAGANMQAGAAVREEATSNLGNISGSDPISPPNPAAPTTGTLADGAASEQVTPLPDQSAAADPVAPSVVGSDAPAEQVMEKPAEDSSAVGGGVPSQVDGVGDGDVAAADTMIAEGSPVAPDQPIDDAAESDMSALSEPVAAPQPEVEPEIFDTAATSA